MEIQVFYLIPEEAAIPASFIILTFAHFHICKFAHLLCKADIPDA